MQHVALLFSEENNASRESGQYVVYLEVSSFLVMNKMITVRPHVLVKSHEACWIQRHLHPILWAKFDVYIWRARVLGLKRHEVICWFLLKRFFSSSIGSLIFPNTNMSTCPNKTMSF